MSTRRLRTVAAQAWKIRYLGVIFAASCSPTEPTLCPAAGCTSALKISFSQAPELGTVVSVVSLDTGEDPLAWTVVCGVDVDCSQGIVFPDFRPRVASVQVTSTKGSVEHVVTPEYAETEGCGTPCFFAEVGPLALP